MQHFTNQGAPLLNVIESPTIECHKAEYLAAVSLYARLMSGSDSICVANKAHILECAEVKFFG